MVRGIERDYDEFTRLKDESSNKVNEQNAHLMFEDAKNQIMKKIKKLDIQNVTEVENLYINVAQLTAAASYMAAINKASRKQTSCDAELSSIGTEDVNPIVFDAFKDHPQVLDLQRKIMLLEAISKPSKQAWAGLHIRMLTLAKAIQADHIMSVLSETLPKYENYLENKLRENGVEIPLPKEMPEDTPPIIQKMVTRYQALLDLGARIQGKEKLDENDVKFATSQIKKCLDNKPDWAERPFLQKLTDVLSLGIKPLYRTFFSKEKELQTTIEQSIETPKMGG